MLRHSEITPADAALKTAGNRYDVVGGGVLYAATELVTCYAETLSRFRPSPAIVAAWEADPDEHYMAVGGVARDWRTKRAVAMLTAPDGEAPLPFLDVEAAATQEYLSRALATDLLALGYEENLTVAEICGMDRRLSRAIALHAYTATTEDGDFVYSGLRYVSKLHTAWECWAIFDATPIEVVGTQSIELTDPALKEVEEMWRLRIF